MAAAHATDRPGWSQVLRSLREVRGYTQEAWADWLGLSRKTVQRWERGATIPDAHGEAALLTLCEEKGLFRTYAQGPLQGGFTADQLRRLLAEARLAGGARATVPGRVDLDATVAAPAVVHIRPPTVLLPTGTLTFLFTDVAGSTRLWEAQPQAMRQVMAQHDALLTRVFEQHDGVVVRPRGEGDSLFAVFVRASDAVVAAVAGQQALAAADWGAVGSLRVRMGLHTGEADLREGDYYGRAVNRTARIRAAAHGGQVLLAQATAQLVRASLPSGAELLDLGPYWLKDLREPERLFQLSAPGLGTAFPPPQALDAAPAVQLPTPLTSFIGREQELANVMTRLATTRLLTLIGPGGTGKTRLAIAAAQRLADAFADGVWFVDLSGVGNPEGVIPAIAQVLEVRESEGRSLVAALAAFLRSKRLLLVLDNVEQVVEAASLLRELLGAAPGVRLLVTSRIRLQLEGEQECPVPPLPLPPTDTGPAPDRLGQNPAIQLFVERARALQPDFRLTSENAAAVAAICRHLDGLPLAIELAAARIRVLTPQAMLPRLDHSLTLLTGGGRDRPARHQTLRAALRWSWGLLAPAEQALLRRLAVFAGGFTLEAVDAVCMVGELDLDVLDGLTSLVEKSLVQRAEVRGEPRFSMLASLREFGLAQLEAAGEAETIHRRWAAHYVGLAEAAATRYWQHGRIAEVAFCEHEQANLRAVLDWTTTHGDPEMGLRLVGAMDRWWFQRAPGEGRSLAEALLALAGAACTAAARGSGAWGAGMAAWALGDFPAALAHLQETVALARAMNDPLLLARALAVSGVSRPSDQAARARQDLAEALTVARGVQAEYVTGFVALFTGLYLVNRLERPLLEQAQRFAEDGLQIGRRLHADDLTAASLAVLGNIAFQQGELPRARTSLEEALARFRALKDRDTAALVLLFLAQVEAALGTAAAFPRWQEALASFADVGHRVGMVTAVLGVAAILAVHSNAVEAVRFVAAVAAHVDEARGSVFAIVAAPAYEEVMRLAKAALDDAAFQQAWDQGSALPLDQIVTEALELAPPNLAK